MYYLIHQFTNMQKMTRKQNGRYVRVRVPCKQRRVDFKNAKQIFDLTQFVITHVGRSRFSDHKSDSSE